MSTTSQSTLRGNERCRECVGVVDAACVPLVTWATLPKVPRTSAYDASPERGMGQAGVQYLSLYLHMSCHGDQAVGDDDKDAV